MLLLNVLRSVLRRTQLVSSLSVTAKPIAQNVIEDIRAAKSHFLWEGAEVDRVYPENPRLECLEMIRRTPTRALDIGCGSGAVGREIHRIYPKCALWGAELDSLAAYAARQCYDEILEGNIENIDFTSISSIKPFDLVCLFDVLEHLINPWILLRKLQTVISSEAQILVSIPNASNIFLICDAVNGFWRYQNWGLLDFTHLRFFSDFDARKMFYQTGYRVIEHRENIIGHGKSTFAQYSEGPFPISITFGKLTMDVESKEELIRLCADQNLYLISPHHNIFNDISEIEMASDYYPSTLAYGGN